MAYPVPAITDDNEAFWTGGHAGELRITRCADCARYAHPPARRCPFCLSEAVAPQPVSGRGRVYSFTINRQRWQPDLEVPYVVAVIELDEQPGLRILSNVVGCAVEDVAIDQPVRVEFQERGAAAIPVFRPEAA